MELKNAMEGLKCISCGEYDLSILNFSRSSSESKNQNQLTEQQTSFFENLDDILVQNRIDTPTRWSFTCFLSRYGIFQGKEALKASDFQIDSAIHEFEKISKKDRLLKNLKLFLFGQNVEIPKIRSDKLALEFAREILYVASHYGSLYRTLQLLFKPLLSEITDLRLFKLLGYSAFSLYAPAPPKEFWSIRLLTTNEQYRDVIYYSQDISFLSTLQADYINHFQYPADFPGSLTFNSSSCSLLMTSIFKNLHFVDLLSQLFREKIHKLEIGLIPEVARVAPSFIPFLFAAYQPFIYLSPQIFLRLISAKLPAINNPENNFCYKNNNLSENIIELQQRFINDLLFTKLVVDLNNENFNNFNNDQNSNTSPKKPEKKKFFGKKKKTEDTANNNNNSNNTIIKPKVRRDSDLGLFIRDFGCPVNEILKDHSIPFLCNGHFRRPEFIEFETKKFYIFSDEEVKNDFDFVHIYNAITDTIALLQTTRVKTQNIIQIQRSLLTSIEKTLQLIREPNLLTKVAIDIFSLIFIKEDKTENSNFLCQNLGIAYLIIQILKKFFNNDRFIKFGSLLLAHYSKLVPRGQIIDLSSILKSNLNFLLDMIIRRNWSDASDIAHLLTGNQKNNLDPRSKIYWRTFILSLGVNQLISGKFCNIECEEFKEDLNLEISLSSSIYNTDDCINYCVSLNEKKEDSKEKGQKLALIDDIKKIREHRKKIEVEDFFSPLCDSYWIDVEPAVVNLEMFPIDFFTNKLIERYEKPLKKSKSLFKFVNFINVYFKCTHPNNSFEFNPIKAISTAFNNGQIELAEEMSSIMNIDLFDFVMNNQKEIKFSPKSVDYFNSKHPLECAEIYYYINKKQQLNSKETKFDEKIEKIFNYLNSDKINDSQTTLEEPIEIEFIELIKSSKENINNDNELYKIFDDYLYKLNHSRIAQIVVSNFDNINKDVALYLLDIVGYTIDDTNNSLNEEIKKLLLMKEIEKNINSKDNIIDNLIELNKFNLATKFINLNIQSQKEKDEICIKIARKLLINDFNSINKFILGFENQSYLYELIASEIPEKIPELIEICPNSIRPFLIAFYSLPESIRSSSSLVDKSTITKAICNQIHENRNIDSIFLLNEKHLILFNDENIHSIINELDNININIQDFIKCSSYLSKIFNNRNDDIFIDANSHRILKEIELINVDSIEKEFDTFLIISKLYRFSRICKINDKISNVLKAFRLLMLESPFYFTKIQFSYRSNLFDVLIKMDLDSIAFLLPKEIFDKFDYTKQKVQIMLNLGRFDDALHILNVNKQFVYEMDELFLCPFLYKQFYQSNLLLLICNLCSNVDQYFSQFKTLSNQDSELAISLNSTLSNLLNYKEFVSHCKTKVSKLPFLSFCSDFCERFSTKDSFFRFCIRRGAMTTVVSKFMTLDENENFNYDINNNAQDLFINSIVECSIEYDKLQLLKKEMIDYSKFNSNNNAANYWKYLIKFCEKKELGFLMLEASQILSLKDKIALSYIDIFGEIDQKDISKKIKYLDKARLALKECIETQQPIINSKEKETSFKSSKIRRNRSASFTHSENDNVTDSSYSQQSSSILFDPDEFNSRNPDLFCEYDNCSGSTDDDDGKKIRRSNSAKKNRAHLGFTELLAIADLLSQLLPYFLEKNEPFSESMNLFNGSLACLTLGGFFLRNGKFDLLRKISEVMKIPQKAIVNAFFEFITQYKDLKLNHTINPNENQSNKLSSAENTNSNDESNDKANLDSNTKDIENSEPNLAQSQKSDSNENINNDENLNANKPEIVDDSENTDLNQSAHEEINPNLNENNEERETTISNENTDSNEKEIIQFIEDTKNEVDFWNNNNYYYVHLYVSKLSFSKNFSLIPTVLSKLLPPEKEPEMLLEFDFLNQAFMIAKDKNVATELLPTIAARSSILGDFEMVKKCEEELGIKTEISTEIENNE